MVAGEKESITPVFVVFAGILTELCKEYPNDMELGAAVRKVANELNTKYLSNESVKTS